MFKLFLWRVSNLIFNVIIPGNYEKKKPKQGFLLVSSFFTAEFVPKLLCVSLCLFFFFFL